MHAECQNLERVGYTSMVLNALVDPILPQSEQEGQRFFWQKVRAAAVYITSVGSNIVTS